MENFRLKGDRFCFGCNKLINKEHYLDTNFRESLKHLAMVWNSKYVQLYCCSCFVKAKMDVANKKIKENLRKAQETLRASAAVKQMSDELLKSSSHLVEDSDELLIKVRIASKKHTHFFDSFMHSLYNMTNGTFQGTLITSNDSREPRDNGEQLAIKHSGDLSW